MTKVCVLVIPFIICLTSFVHAQGEFTSLVNGSWNSSSTWALISGTDSDGVPDADDKVTIAPGHVVKVLYSYNHRAGELIISAGASIYMTGGTLSIADGNPLGYDLKVYGSIEIYTSGLTLETSATAIFYDGATFRQRATSGLIPAATWQPNSLCEIMACTSITWAMNQEFGNLTWNCASQASDYQLNGQIRSIKGNFTVASTKNYLLILNSPALTISGNFIIKTGGRLAFTNNTAICPDVNITGDISIEGGSVSSVNGTAVITLNKPGEQNISSSTIINFTKCSWIVAPGTVVNINANFCIIKDSGERTLTVEGVLNCGNRRVYGSGGFILNPGATLIIGSAEGITNISSKGTIQVTGTRIFSGEGNYIYNGNTVQSTGNLLPDNVRDLIVDNPAGVIMTRAVNVNNRLMMVQGGLDLNGNTITLGPVARLDESSGGIVKGDSGLISATRELGILKDEDVAGVGALITTTQAPGITTIRRGHLTHQLGEATSIQRYYDIIPQHNMGAGAQLVFKYTHSELNSVTEENLGLFRSGDEGASWQPAGGILDLVNNTITTPIVDGYTRWTAGDINKPLPVELNSFDAFCRGDYINLLWTTATEVNNYGFEIERRQPGVAWRKLGFVPGNGNSNSPRQYSYCDKGISQGKYSYRLKQIDTDGKYCYLGEAEAPCNTGVPYNLAQNYPNPFNPITHIGFSIPEETFVSIRVYDVLGNEVTKLVNEVITAGYHELFFDASEYSSGIYFYRLETGKYSCSRKMQVLK
ncbi:MAG: T9SS type A sorting domain-containing protein [Ignavibacteriales bacterium]